MSDHYYAVSFNEDHLEHHGILGMKWGVRRYQNPDGTLTEEGKKRYAKIIIGDSSPQDNVFGPFKPKKSLDFKGNKRYKAGKMFEKSSVDDLISFHEKMLGEGYSREQLQWLEGEINHKNREKYVEYRDRLSEKESQENERLLKQLKNSETISKITEEDSKKLHALLDKSYEIVDWYNGWARDPADTQRLEELKRLESGHRGPMTDEEYKKYKKVKNQILSSVLNGIGIKDTEENRRLIENQVFWD